MPSWRRNLADARRFYQGAEAPIFFAIVNRVYQFDLPDRAAIFCAASHHAHAAQTPKDPARFLAWHDALYAVANAPEPTSAEPLILVGSLGSVRQHLTVPAAVSALVASAGRELYRVAVPESFSD